MTGTGFTQSLSSGSISWHTAGSANSVPITGSAGGTIDLGVSDPSTQTITAFQSGRVCK